MITSAAQNPNFTYNADGQYTVRLTVKDTVGQSAFFTQVVTINTDTNKGCDGIASWSSATSYKIGDKVAHNNKIYEATWWSTGANPEVYSNVRKRLGNCSGDGATSMQASPSHIYTQAGSYLVSLTVKDA